MNKKIKKIIKNPLLLLVFLDSKNIIRLKDKTYLKLLYPYYFSENLNLTNPKTFNEKLQWLKLYDRKDIYTTMVDKYEAKKYVSKIIGNEHIVPTLGVYDNFDDINFDALPNKFVLKTNHYGGGGGVFIVNNKKEFNIEEAKRKIDKLMKKNLYYYGREWPYKNVKPRIIIEKNMGVNLNDYKFFCFNGDPKYILVCSNRNGSQKNTDFYDCDWNLQPFTREKHDNNPKGIEKPQSLREMYSIAKQLCKDIPFVRVDLYDINNTIYFGELTFFPSSGFEGFKPKEWDKKLGDLINLKIGKDNNL